jgi:hypothetical protein
MSAASDYLEDAILDHTLGVSALAQPTPYVALYITNPTDADSGTEVTGGSYGREAVTFGAASGGISSNSAAVEFTKATANWGTISHIGIRDASSGGNLLYHGALSSSVVIDTDDIFRIPIGDLDVSAD